MGGCDVGCCAAKWRGGDECIDIVINISGIIIITIINISGIIIITIIIITIIIINNNNLIIIIIINNNNNIIIIIIIIISSLLPLSPPSHASRTNRLRCRHHPR